ncbi:hypothetical protein FA15DRAFT_607329 [Coprinopsis marcescibilis]|uniref:Uncharacterized protein n=1 Tax=Coprinopsis marcescibilis TaxID=230819 RepID=A0A5C3K8P5_COPMA|nr:hypothetical protein FA15DRAFT_607329 [Coprinopsis marcescibilis]
MHQSRSSKARLIFPVSCIHRSLKKGITVAILALVPSHIHWMTVSLLFLATVLKYLMVEVLELACIAAGQIGRWCITPCPLEMVTKADVE